MKKYWYEKYPPENPRDLSPWLVFFTLVGLIVLMATFFAFTTLPCGTCYMD